MRACTLWCAPALTFVCMGGNCLCAHATNNFIFELSCCTLHMPHMLELYICTVVTLITKKIKFSSDIRKFGMEQLQSHIWMTSSSCIGKYLRISSYTRKPFLIYDFATAPLWIFLYMRKIWFFFFLSVHAPAPAPLEQWRQFCLYCWE
jgi:hypothetical protein